MLLNVVTIAQSTKNASGQCSPLRHDGGRLARTTSTIHSPATTMAPTTTAAYLVTLKTS